MPELPEVELYVRALRARVIGQTLHRLRILSPSVLRTFDPPAAEFDGRVALAVTRLGKRIVLEFEAEYFAALHLMIAGRLRWLEPDTRPPRKGAHALLEFGNGSLLLTEAGTRRRASLHLLRGRAALAALDRGGIEPLAASEAEFAAALQRENRTLKRALTDPRIFSGIGNAHSDEILFRARLSPARRTRQLTPAEISQLYAHTRQWLQHWTDHLIATHQDRFPERITAFHSDYAVHGRYGKPCPVCNAPVQRIVFAEHETNYCARCQTDGRLLADRAFSRLLGEDWPRTLDELES